MQIKRKKEKRKERGSDLKDSVMILSFPAASTAIAYLTTRAAIFATETLNNIFAGGQAPVNIPAMEQLSFWMTALVGIGTAVPAVLSLLWKALLRRERSAMEAGNELAG